MIFESGFFKEQISDSALNESYKNARETRYFSAGKKTVFLSHKHDDIIDLKGVIKLLENYNIHVYIDRMDNLLPNQTTGQTANRIKQVIEKSNKFILLATHRAIESIWCNWELGIGDGFKYIDDIAILPIKEKKMSDLEYKGNEYLQIYPRIDLVDYVYIVKYPDGRAYSLRNWLQF